MGKGLCHMGFMPSGLRLEWKGRWCLWVLVGKGLIEVGWGLEVFGHEYLGSRGMD